MKAAVLFSGGKDSAYAACLCLSWGWEAELLTIEPEEGSMMFHHPNTEWCALQAKAAGLKHHVIKTKNENELIELEEKIRQLKYSRNIEGIVTGAVASEYQKQRIELIGEALSLPTFNPLWHKGEGILREMAENMEIIVVSVSAEGLDEEWLGRKLDGKAIDELKSMRPPLNIFFEGGEAETFVADAPFFKKKIKIKKMEKSFSGSSGSAKIISASLERI